MGWTYLGGMIYSCEILCGNHEGKSHLEDLGFDVRILLK
jgi:hypothetical protein